MLHKKETIVNINHNRKMLTDYQTSIYFYFRYKSIFFYLNFLYCDLKRETLTIKLNEILKHKSWNQNFLWHTLSVLNYNLENWYINKKKRIPLSKYLCSFHNLIVSLFTHNKKKPLEDWLFLIPNSFNYEVDEVIKLIS